ncbi:tyrosinase family protein [Nonomuraea sp. NPDC050556]|uniref:tyrosinase family protein n=1 Tax=Nonomuraea sp. NPDC050556 TaxID=3364369 RepID=UPI0037A02620
MATPDRRGLFRLAAGGAAAVVVSRAGMAQAATPPPVPLPTLPPLPCLELVHKKKTIKICPPGKLKDGLLLDAIQIDGVSLKAMAHKGRFVTVLNQHVDFGSLEEAALHGAELLRGAKLFEPPGKSGLKPHAPEPCNHRLRAGQVRKTASALTAAERADFVKALLTLKSQGTYDWFVDVHRRAFDNHQWNAHMHAGFLPWHRAFLLLFEAQLERIKPGLALPYWDWSVQQSLGVAPFTTDFLGGNGRVEDGQVMDGPFAYRNGQWKLTVRNDDREFLRRELGSRAAKPSPPSAVTAALSNTVYDRAPYDSTVTGFRNAVEGWPSGPTMHNRAHVWTGGSMLPASSPNDPAFFMNHCFVDKIWSDWQTKNPNVAQFLPPELMDVPLEPFKSEAGWSITPRQLLNHRGWYTYA